MVYVCKTPEEVPDEAVRVVVEADRVLALALVDRLVVEKLLSGVEIASVLGETSGRLLKSHKAVHDEGNLSLGKFRPQRPIRLSLADNHVTHGCRQ